MKAKKTPATKKTKKAVTAAPRARNQVRANALDTGTTAPLAPKEDRKALAVSLHGQVLAFKQKLNSSIFAVALALKEIRDKGLYKELGAHSWEKYLADNADLHHVQVSKWFLVIKHFKEPDAVYGVEKLALYAAWCVANKVAIAPDLSTLMVTVEGKPTPFASITSSVAATIWAVGAAPGAVPPEEDAFAVKVFNSFPEISSDLNVTMRKMSKGSNRIVLEIGLPSFQKFGELIGKRYPTLAPPKAKPPK